MIPINIPTPGLGALTSLVAGANWIVLTMGFLYVYKKQSARRSENAFPLVNMKTCIIDFKDEKKFVMTMKKNKLTFKCEDKWICQKWVNSVNLMYKNLGDYLGPENVGADAPAKEDKYLQAAVYQKVTGKTCYKDYEVICDNYEQKAMMHIFYTSLLYLQSNPPKGAKKTKFTLAELVKKRVEKYQEINSVGKKKKKTGEVLETDEEQHIRHEGMIEMEEFTELINKVNPNQVDFYDACFSAEGYKGTICQITDRRAMDMVLNRIRNGVEGVSEIDSMRYSSQSFVAKPVTELNGGGGLNAQVESRQSVHDNMHNDSSLHDYNDEDINSDEYGDHSYDSQDLLDQDDY